METSTNLVEISTMVADVLRQNFVGQDVAGAGGHGAEGSGAAILLENVRYHSGNFY